jgi:hypothetical protein
MKISSQNKGTGEKKRNWNKRNGTGIKINSFGTHVPGMKFQLSPAR